MSEEIKQILDIERYRNKDGYVENINLLPDEMAKLFDYITSQDKEIERLNNIINKAIEYIETHQLNFKKGTTTFGSERLSMEERKLLDILRGEDK